MRIGIALDKDGDFLTGTYATGHTSFALCSGAELITQSIKVGLSSGAGEIWFNLARGIDKQSLFFNPQQSEDFLMPMRSLAVKEFLQTFEDVVQVDGEASFIREDRVMHVTAPCVILNCEASNQRIEIGELNVC